MLKPYRATRDNALQTTVVIDMTIFGRRHSITDTPRLVRAHVQVRHHAQMMNLSVLVAPLSHHPTIESACTSCDSHRLRVTSGVPFFPKNATCQFGDCGDGSYQLCWCYNEQRGPPKYDPCPSGYRNCPAAGNASPSTSSTPGTASINSTEESNSDRAVTAPWWEGQSTVQAACAKCQSEGYSDCKAGDCAAGTREYNERTPGENLVARSGVCWCHEYSPLYVTQCPAAFKNCDTGTAAGETSANGWQLVPPAPSIARLVATSRSSIFLALGIITIPSRFRRRQLFRETVFTYPQVSQEADRRVAVHFVVGNPSASDLPAGEGPKTQSQGDSSDATVMPRLAEEEQTFGDILILQAVPERGSKQMDCAHKTHAFFSWALLEYPDALFLGKVEDDSLPHIPLLVGELTQLQEESATWHGAGINYGLMMFCTSGCWGGDVDATATDGGLAGANANLQVCHDATANADASALDVEGPYGKESLLNTRMGTFAAGPIDIRSRGLAQAIAKCDWVTGVKSSGLWASKNEAMDTCDGQQGRIMNECGQEYTVAQAGWAKVGTPDSQVIGHPLKDLDDPRPQQWMDIFGKTWNDTYTSAPVTLFDWRAEHDAHANPARGVALTLTRRTATSSQAGASASGGQGRTVQLSRDLARPVVYLFNGLSRATAADFFSTMNLSRGIRERSATRAAHA